MPSVSRIRSNRPPFLRQNSRDGESPSHSSRPSRGSSVCSSSSKIESNVVTARKSRLERSSLAGDVSPISESGSTFSDEDFEEMGRKERGRLQASSNLESESLIEKKSVVLSDLSDGEFTGDEAVGEVSLHEQVVSDLDSISDNELTEIIGSESDGMGISCSTVPSLVEKKNVYRDIEIDWSSLIAAPKLDVKSLSARKRYSGLSVLKRIGFSAHFAGESLTKQLKEEYFCHGEGKSINPTSQPQNSFSTSSGTLEAKRMARCFHQIIKRRKEEGILLFPNKKSYFVCSNI